ncbi:MAG TPA: Gfo/Idh/MocA family oxidoreductase [Anaerolineae bacterium]|nr:Gfo/Idh/MocA family oxidoreductase [Anaerolineae bacterium]
MRKIKLGLIGIGVIGNLHLENIAKSDKVELTAVCDVIPERARAAAERYGCPAYLDSAALLKDRVCEAVLIATPHYAHTTIGIAALESGHHVLVEKPISVHKADCERLIAAHQGTGLVFAAMFNVRTVPHYQKIKAMVEQGELGPLQRISWIITEWFRTEAYYASGGWRATWAGEGGGVLLNQCPHNLDLLQWMCGMPTKVWGFCSLGKRHTIEVEDEVTAYMEYPGGCTATFITSTGEAPGTNRFEIAGDKGKLVLEHGTLTFTRNEVPASEFLKTSRESFARPGVQVVDVPVEGPGGEHMEILENFADAIREGAPLIAPAEQGLHSVELANAMLYSSLTGQPVTLPLDGRAFERELKKLIATSTFVKGEAVEAQVDVHKSFSKP